MGLGRQLPFRGSLDISAFVYKHEPTPPHMIDPSQDPRSYPLHASARAQPGDSLWISYNTRGRYCFDCPR